MKQLEVEELKIERSFIRHLVDDAKDRAIALSTIELAHNLGVLETWLAARAGAGVSS